MIDVQKRPIFDRGDTLSEGHHRKPRQRVFALGTECSGGEYCLGPSASGAVKRSNPRSNPSATTPTKNKSPEGDVFCVVLESGAMPRPAKPQPITEDTWRDNLPDMCRHPRNEHSNPDSLPGLCLRCRIDAGDPAARRAQKRREDRPGPITPSNPRWTPQQRAEALTHACGHCGQPAGQPCRLPDKGVLDWPHGQRRYPPAPPAMDEYAHACPTCHAPAGQDCEGGTIIHTLRKITARYVHLWKTP